MARGAWNRRVSPSWPHCGGCGECDGTRGGEGRKHALFEQIEGVLLRVGALFARDGQREAGIAAGSSSEMRCDVTRGTRVIQI